MQVALSAFAEADLLDIALYIAEDNPDRALSFADELQEACNGLADRPLRFPLLPGFETSGLRRRVHGRYSIIYRIDADNIQVLRVVSNAMDLSKVLG